MEAIRSSALFLLVLLADVVILRTGVVGGSTPSSEVVYALIALNVVGFVLAIHWARQSSIRKEQWMRVYPLESTTVLDSVLGYFDERRLRTRNVGERNVYMDSYSDVIRCIDPFFEVALRSVSFLGKGVAVHVGPEDDINKDAIIEFMDEFDEFIEKDLLEGIPSRPSDDDE